MARKPTATRPSTIKSLDFTGVEMGAKLIDEGDYRVVVSAVEEKPGKEYPYWAWKFKVAEGEEEAGVVLYLNTSLTPNSLWNLRNLLEALGMEIPAGPVDIDFDDLIDLEMVAVTQHETYEGKKRSSIVDFYAAEDEPEAKPEPVKPAKGAKGKAAAEPEALTKGAKPGKKAKLEPLESDEVAEMDEDDLQGVVDKYELNVDLAEFKTLRKKQNAVIDGLEAIDMIAAE